MTVPFFDGAQLQHRRVGAQRVALDLDGLGLALGLGDPLLRLGLHGGDLRLGGLSGIWKGGDYRRGYTERPPYGGSDVKTAYHVREFDVWKLRQLRQPLDVFLSHDWPRGVAAHGNAGALFRAKPFLKAEVLDGSLGSQPNAELLAQLQPDYWFRRGAAQCVRACADTRVR